MRFISLLPLFFLLGSCCSDPCDCEDDCKKNYVFTFDMGPGEYVQEDIDTLQILYKFEGTRSVDTSFLYLNTGKYYPLHPCAGNAQILLDKSIPDKFGKLTRVEIYKVFTAVDSFRIDGMDLTLTKSGDKCCRCIHSVERKFQLDSVEIIQTSIHPIPIPIIRKK